jgi:hypothetical protein
MSTATAAVATKPAPTPPAAPAPRKHQLPISNLKPVGHFKEPQQAMLPAGWEFEDVFDPGFWASIAPTFQAAGMATGQDTIGTEIEVRTLDHAFFARLYVMGLRKNAMGQADGLYVECIGPAFDPKTGVPCALDLKTKRPLKTG